MQRGSSLVQGRLEIPSKVTTRMSETIRNRNLIVTYNKMIELLHIKSDSSVMLGFFLYSNTGNDNEQYGKTAGGSTKKQPTD